MIASNGPLAQLVEQLTLNQLVRSSSLRRVILLLTYYYRMLIRSPRKGRIFESPEGHFAFNLLLQDVGSESPEGEDLRVSGGSFST